MFVSLNKKFLYTISAFFLLTAIIFICSFYFTYGIRLQKELQTAIMRNQQYVELLYENNNLKKELKRIRKENMLPNIYDEGQLEQRIAVEKKRIVDLQKSYNDRYLSIYQGFKFVGISSIIFIAAIILIWFLVKRWVIVPIEKLTETNRLISEGKLDARVEEAKELIFSDEIDYLTKAFNNMLNTLEKNVSTIKNAQFFLQKIVDGIPDGLRVIDENYKIIIANRAYYKQVGTNKKHLKCYEASYQKDVPCNHNLITCPLHEICQNKKKQINVIQQFNHDPNKYLYINAAALKVNDKNYVIEVIRDLSGDIEFSHQQKISSLGFLSSSIAHEMKNHLGSIRLIIECLNDNNDFDEQTKKLFNLIHKEIVETVKVPERLLNLSRIQQNVSTEINCVQNIKDIVELMDYEAKIKGINITANVKDNVKINGNEADFKMVMINLILNAIHAGKPNGIIEITAKTDKKHSIITVHDNGVGIPPNIKAHIFEPLFSGQTNGQIKGNGLGLAIVKSIVDKFGGEISVKSTMGKGTTFTLRFPLCK